MNNKELETLVKATEDQVRELYVHLMDFPEEVRMKISDLNDSMRKVSCELAGLDIIKTVLNPQPVKESKNVVIKRKRGRPRKV
jgi:hypothetical protein